MGLNSLEVEEFTHILVGGFALHFHSFIKYFNIITDSLTTEPGLMGGFPPNMFAIIGHLIVATNGQLPE
jgi:hypothetical protein